MLEPRLCAWLHHRWSWYSGYGLHLHLFCLSCFPLLGHSQRCWWHLILRFAQFPSSLFTRQFCQPFLILWELQNWSYRFFTEIFCWQESTEEEPQSKRLRNARERTEKKQVVSLSTEPSINLRDLLTAPFSFVIPCAQHALLALTGTVSMVVSYPSIISRTLHLLSTQAEARCLGMSRQNSKANLRPHCKRGISCSALARLARPWSALPYDEGWNDLKGAYRAFCSRHTEVRIWASGQSCGLGQKAVSHATRILPTEVHF